MLKLKGRPWKGRCPRHPRQQHEGHKYPASCRCCELIAAVMRAAAQLEERKATAESAIAEADALMKYGAPGRIGRARREARCDG